MGTSAVPDGDEGDDDDEEEKAPLNSKVNALASAPAHQAALEYLEKWKEEKSAWKFSKKLQTHLLLCWWDPTVLDRDHFKILLAYSEGLQGGARQKTLEQAEERVRLYKAAKERAESEERE